MIREPVSVLLAEDESVSRRLAGLLEDRGYAVETVFDGSAALDRASRGRHDVIVLADALPSGNGSDVCRDLRRLRPSAPIILLLRSEDDAIDGRDSGADAVLTKPITARDLLRRVEEVSRLSRSSNALPEEIRIDGCLLQLERGIAKRGGKSVPLTAREVGILRWLYNHRTRAVSRPELLEEVWGVPGDLQTRTVDMTISNLRRKIEDTPSRPRLVVTVKGVGYSWGHG